MQQRLKVLLLDDSVVVVRAIQSFLREQGFDARAVSTVVEFERLLQSWQPDVVLTDVRMPETSGVELCRHLKSRLNQLVPVLLFSSLPDGELRRLAHECGADGFVSKRSGLGELRTQLREVCEAILW